MLSTSQAIANSADHLGKAEQHATAALVGSSAGSLVHAAANHRRQDQCHPVAEPETLRSRVNAEVAIKTESLEAR